jgi:hypothetical protein
MARLPLAFALSLALLIAACDGGPLQAPPASPLLRGGAALEVAGRGTLSLDRADRPLMTSPDGSARLELRAPGATRTDVHFLAEPAAGEPLTLEWRADRRLVQFASQARRDGHDLRVDLQASGALSATLRTLNNGRVTAEAVVPTHTELPIGTSVSVPTSLHVHVYEDGTRVIVVDYNMQGSTSTSLTSDVLGLKAAEVTHVEVALQETRVGGRPEEGTDVLSIGGARSVSILDVTAR